jgi:AcrR family transcriptional regulator
MSSSWTLPAISERERALLATAEIWSEIGFDGLGAEAICSRAGIDSKVFAALFPTVEAAAEATIEVPLGSVVRIVGQQFSPDRSEAESYALAIAGILELLAANPAYTYTSFIGGRQMASERVHEIYETGRRFLIAMLERLWEISGAKEQPPRTARAALGAAEAVVRREIVAGRYHRLPFLATDFIYVATVPFLGQAQALGLARKVRERRLD